MLLPREICVQSLKTKLTGPKFFNSESGSFDSQVFTENGKFAEPGAFENEISLSKGFAFPAFRDGHAHPIFAGREAQGPVVSHAKSIAEIQAILGSYRKANPDQSWVEGGAYDRSIIEGGLFQAQWLDEVISEVPVVLHASDHHTIWVNTKALESIPRPIPTLPSGSVDIDLSGNPTGVLREPDAMALVLDRAPKRSIEQEVAALNWADKLMAEFGIVQAQDAWITAGMTDVYLAAIEAGSLLLDYNLAFKIEPQHWEKSIQFAAAERLRVNNLNSPKLTAKTVKFFADGVFGSGTASVLEPYLDNHENHGEPLWSEDDLKSACLAAGKLGFQLHIHAIGDAGVRQALDAIEFVQVNLGEPVLPNVIAHAELISNADIERFRKLNVVANMQPLWAQADGMLLSCVPRLGEGRIDQMYRMRDLINEGATIAFGSDWPVSSADPILGIATAVTRQTADSKPDGGWTPEQAMNVVEALYSYSEAVTYQLTGKMSTGFTVGQSCDFVILDKNPLEIKPSEIRSIKVLETYKSGVRIF